MAIKDELIIQYYTLATNVSMTEVKEAESALEKGEHPMTIKKQLAFQIVEELCGLENAEIAKNAFQKRVQEKEINEGELEEFAVNKEQTIIDILVQNHLAESKSDVKRLIEQGAVLLNDEKISDANTKISQGILKIGKRKIIKIMIK